MAEQDSLSNSWYMLNKRNPLEELRRAIRKIGRNKGIDPHIWHRCLLKYFTVSFLSLFLHLLNTCVEAGFWPFKQVLLIVLKKPGNAASCPSSYRCISVASHAGESLERKMDDRIRRLDFLDIEKEQYGFI